MKTIKKIISAVIIALTIISCFASAASAKNVCNRIEGRANLNGGNSTVFTVKTNDTKKHTVKMSMKKGELGDDDNILINNVNIYGYYEIKIFSVKNGKADKQLNKYNVKNKSNHTITLQGYKEYEIRVYNWKCATIAKSGGYCKNYITKEQNYCKWVVIPTWSVVKTSGITLCK